MTLYSICERPRKTRLRAQLRNGSGNDEIANKIVRLCETFLLIPRLSWFVEVCL